MMKYLDRAAWWLTLRYLFPPSQPCYIKLAGPRVERRRVYGTTELTLIMRDISEPDIYSRGEIFEMLHKVRENEIRMQWKCPEPPERFQP